MENKIMSEASSSPQWLTIEDAVEFYGNSRSSMDRWLREYADLFVVKTENGERYVDVANSKTPPNARLKKVEIPEGYMTLEQAREHYQISRSVQFNWIRDGRLMVKEIGGRKYIDTANSQPMSTRHEPVEDWKTIPWYEDYEACKDGRIRNVKTCNVLTPNEIDGYHYLHLVNQSGKNIISIHKLIATTYIPNPENKLTVNHKNHNRKDNRLENLEWATHSEQNFHKTSKPKRVIIDHNDMDGEIWKPIDSHHGYSVSNKGRVKNSLNKLLTGNYSNYVEVKFDNARYKVHRLVAKAFLSEYTNDCYINHKNGNRHDNNVENLECCSQSHNVLHAYDTGLNTNRVKVRMTKPDGTTQIFKSLKEAGEKTGFNKDSIGYASKNGTKLGGFTWERI